MSEVLLKIENLNKSFGITHANPHFCPRSQVCTEVIPEKCTSVEKSILRKTR